MSTEYQPQAIEAALQQRWESDRAFEVHEDPDKEKYYCLCMLPYPSGALHMGHVRNYTIGDVISRFQRMQGKNVLQPMGWDAFGLPAENAAIKHRVPPAQWTYKNIDHMRSQLKQLGFAYDWSRELATCKPEYYRWEQLMFTRLFEQGLVYRKAAEVNWDPVDQTVLANEQVVDGRGWRSGAPVERREIQQWFLKITDYAEELLQGLDALEGWPDAVKTMQRNWIGRSEGAEFDMRVCDADGRHAKDAARITVFTTRPDTSFGMTYAVLAPEHPMVAEITSDEQREAVTAFVEQARNTSEMDRLADGGLEKRGVFTGAYLLNPFTAEPVPVYLADYVLLDYGSGAIMAVPGQDQRDWDFAEAYGLPVVRTVQPPDGFDGKAYTGDGPAINSEWLNGLDVKSAILRAIEWLESQGLGRRRVNYRLRDWGVSRQRYWGCPIPMIICPDCGPVPVPEEQLPVELPEDVQFMGVQSPIKADPEWRKVDCPACGGAAERETDTFDTFMESSWYYARYCCPDADAQLDRRADYWLPVDQYIGGVEHAILHLMYFRFYHKLMRDAGMVSSDEPATRLLCQGMVVGETFYREDDEGGTQWINPADVAVVRDRKGRVSGAVLRGTDEPVVVGGVEKMSKSKNNGVDPDPLIRRFGADTVRLFSISGSPPDQSREWSESGVEGAHRFLRRLWRGIAGFNARHPSAATVEPAALNDQQKALRRKVHQTIAKVTDDIQRRYTFNTAVAAMMELLNEISRFDDRSDAGSQVLREAWETLVHMLSPVAPHICQHLWDAFGYRENLHDKTWPSVDASALVQDRVTIVLQVNGKKRGKIEIAVDAAKERVQEQALANENVRRSMGQATVRKIIYVPNKLMNIVAS